MTFSLQVYKVNLIKHKINKYIIILIYLLRINKQNNKVLTFITRELYLVMLRVKQSNKAVRL